MLAVNVHTSRSPVKMVPRCITPLVIGPPSSPGETTTVLPVLASVSRYVPVRVPLLSLTMMVNVPVLVAVTATSAAAAPALDPKETLAGLKSWILGVKLVVDSSPTRTTMASPAFALKVHESVSPATLMAPSSVSPGEIVAAPLVAGKSMANERTSNMQALSVLARGRNRGPRMTETFPRDV